MGIRKIHYLSGLTISIFVGLHLFNHFWSIFGAESHIELMNTLRIFYRNIFIESIIMLAAFVQIISGLKLFKSSRKTAISNFYKLHILSTYFLFHIPAWQLHIASIHSKKNGENDVGLRNQKKL